MMQSPVFNQKSSVETRFSSLHGPRTQAGGIPGSPSDLRAIPSGCPFHPRFLAGPQIQPVLQHAQSRASPLPQDHAEQNWR